MRRPRKHNKIRAEFAQHDRVHVLQDDPCPTPAHIIIQTYQVTTAPSQVTHCRSPSSHGSSQPAVRRCIE